MPKQHLQSMALQTFLDGIIPQRSNASLLAHNTSSASIPTSLLESIVPGYGPIHNFILVTLGVDITILVTMFIVVWGLCKVGVYVYMTLYDLVCRNYLSSVHIDNHDDIYDHLMKWLSAQPSIRASRSLMAETQHKSAWEVDEEAEDQAPSDEDAASPFLNFSNQEAIAPPRFIPAVGTHRFWHNGTYFGLHRAQVSVFDDGNAKFADRENLTISCFGRSARPIKQLMQEAKDFYFLDHHAKTIIRRPATKDMRRWGGRHCWSKIAHRPCRPLETVVLDAKRKAEVLSDINEYLHPATPRWYANRGIPYRRGYLFHGPAGTGKTSLSFCIAGLFGLEIFCISLLEPTLTEEDLGLLFSHLPRRCVVLLEDIDTAGLNRTSEDDEEKTSGRSKESSKTVSEGWKISDLAKALKKAESEDEKTKGISLSGLLNAIDGVASHEGRVLVMTTNKPEKLDEALIRPGRVDLQVAFGNATQTQVKELFERMYSPDTSRLSRQTMARSSATLAMPKMPATSTVTSTMVEADGDVPARTLEECARDFASRIPDSRFSPAEIQGFLLKRKRNPQKACREVDKWVESMDEMKVARSKVLTVQ